MFLLFVYYLMMCMYCNTLQIYASERITSKPQYSFAKWGNIFLKKCPKDITNIFPLDQHPNTWQSCEDAYEYTWTHNDDLFDFQEVFEKNDEVNVTLRSGEVKVNNHRYISDLNEYDQLKLIKSTGFCPHRRCQLGNASRGYENGACPVGLCYTQLEEGSPSFGACCYDHKGTFNSGNLIGYYYKTQPTPKPIYKHSRIILDSRRTYPEVDFDFDFDGYESFINANQVLPGMIITQCPLTGFPAGFDDTVEDMLQLLIQANVSMYIQMMNPDKTEGRSNMNHNGPIRNCELLPYAMLKNDRITKSMGSYEDRYGTKGEGLDGSGGFVTWNMLWHHNHTISTTTTSNDDKGENISCPFDPLYPYTNITFEIGWNDEKWKNNWNSKTNAQLSSITSTSTSTSVDLFSSYFQSSSQWIQYVWYSDWHDFGIPPLNAIHDDTIRKLSIHAAREIEKGYNIVLSCSSGRGRSGTFAAIIAGYVYQLNHTHFEVNSEEEDSQFEMKVKSRKLSRLVDIIVEMRSNRDGIVELPLQFYYIRHILGLL